MGWFENLYSTDGKFDLAKAATSAAGLATLYGAVKPDSSVGEFLGMSSAQQPVGYTGGIPEYEVSREALPGAFAATTAEGTPRRPGSMGRRYFTDTTFTPTGGVMEAGSMPAAQTTTPTTQGLLGQLPPEAVVGLLGALTGMGGGVAGGRSTVAEDQQGFVTQPTGGAPDKLLGWLASTGETTVKEIADLFPEYTEAEIGYALIDGGYATPSQLAAQYPDISAEEATEMYRSMGGTKYAGGGLASLEGMGQGYYLGGPTDGMADLIPATIDGNQPAALSDGEFVIPADVVSHLGNGNSDAGAQQLYSMMDRVREERTGTTRQGPEINPTKMMPA